MDAVLTSAMDWLQNDPSFLRNVVVVVAAILIVGAVLSEPEGTLTAATVLGFMYAGHLWAGAWGVAGGLLLGLLVAGAAMTVVDVARERHEADKPGRLLRWARREAERIRKGREESRAH